MSNPVPESGGGEQNGNRTRDLVPENGGESSNGNEMRNLVPESSH